MLCLPEVEAIVSVVVGTCTADDVAGPQAAKFYGETIGILTERAIVKVPVRVAIEQQVIGRLIATGNQKTRILILAGNDLLDDVVRSGDRNAVVGCVLDGQSLDAPVTAI